MPHTHCPSNSFSLLILKLEEKGRVCVCEEAGPAWSGIESAHLKAVYGHKQRFSSEWGLFFFLLSSFLFSFFLSYWTTVTSKAGNSFTPIFQEPGRFLASVSNIITCAGGREIAW